MSTLNPVTDAKGVLSASKVIKAIEEKGVLCIRDIKNVCLATIQRYDQSTEAAELCVTAQDTLNTTDSSIWLKKIEGLARALISNTPIEENIEDNDNVSVSNAITDLEIE